MGVYFGQFIVYTIAMLGIIFAALFVYKRVTDGTGFGGKSDFLNVEDSISLSPRKSLYVIRAGEEKFLVAADLDRTALIAKLGSKLEEQPNFEQKTPRKPSVDDLPTIVNFQKNTGKSSVIRKMVSGVKTNEIDIL